MLAGTLARPGPMALTGTGLTLLRALGRLAGAMLCGLLLVACSSGGGAPETAGSPGTVAVAEPGPAKTAVKIALLVPLSAQGHAGVIGKSLKQAGELALFERDNPALQLIVKDDKGTPEGAKAAAEEAIRGGARLILGPLFAKSATAVAPIARQAGVPVVTFSTDRQVASNGVYLLSFQPAPEVARVVAFAAQQGKRRFAALIPEDALGKIVSAAFKDAVSRAGGTVVALETYAHPPSASAILEPMRKISAAIQTAEAEGAPVDALFLPGGQDSLEVIARLLPQAEIDTEKVKLIGTGGMDYPNVGRDAKLVGAWYPAPDPRGWTEFAEKYAKSYGSAPPRIAGLAYDAVSMAIALSGGGQGQRYDAAELTRASGFTGVDGAFRLLSDGGTDRSLAILEVQRFAARIVDAPPGLASGPPPATSALPRGLFNLN
jgi:branched-chain amino acid transport system substrate-binding protein